MKEQFKNILPKKVLLQEKLSKYFNKILKKLQ